MPYDCFISYSSHDLAFAEELHRRLIAEGFTVWFDKARLTPGCDWHKEIEAGCEASRVLLPVLTPHWKESWWTRFETYGAEAVVPLLVEGAFSDTMTPPLRRFQAETLDFTNPDCLPRVFAAIREFLVRPAPEKTPRIAHLRYRANPYFVGRDESLNRIHEELHQNPTAVLTQGQVRAIAALGGIGKTTLAREYAEKFWRCHPQIIWVDARFGYETEFARICDILFPDLRNVGLKDPEKASRALQELNTRVERLLIIDAAEDERSVQAWLPKTGGCHTLLTSRFAGWSVAVKSIQLHVLEPKPARQFLVNRTDRSVNGEERVACDELAERLGFLPLALEQAAAYIAEQGLAFGFADYLRLYEAATRELLSLHALGSTEYPDPVITTWKATIAKLSPESRAILHLAAFMAPTPIPFEMFADSARVLRELAAELGDVSPLQDDTLAEVWMRAAVIELKRYSMVQFNGSEIQVHNLVQTVERLNLPVPERVRWWDSAVKVFERHAPINAYRFEVWSTWKQLLPHGESLYRHAAALKMPEVHTPFLWELANYYGLMGRYSDALPLATQAVLQNEATLGLEHPDTLYCLSTLAYLQARQGDYATAEPLLRRELEVSERLLGREHPSTLTSVNNLAYLLQSMGKYPEAESLHRRVLEAFDRSMGREHADTLTSMSNLATLLDDKGDCATAESLFQRILEARERLLGLEHPDTLTSLNNFANSIRRKGAYSEAEPLYRRALDASERVLGPDHPDTLATLNALAGLMMTQGDYAGAEPIYRRVRAIQERVLGPTHPVNLSTVNDLAYLLLEKGDLTGSEELYRQVLADKMRVLGPQHPSTLTTLNNLAYSLAKQSDYASAEPLYRRAIDEQERVLGLEHPDTLTSVNNLALLLQSKGGYAEAEQLFRRAFKARSRVLGSEHPDALASLNNQAALLESQGDLAGAERMFQRALAAKERILGPEHPETLISLSNLASLLSSKGEYAEAEPMFQRSVAAQKRILGTEHLHTLTSLSGLALMFWRQGDYARAEPLNRHAVDAFDRVLGSDHPVSLTSVNNLAALLEEKGECAEAERLFKQVLKTRYKTLGLEHSDTLTSLNNLAHLLQNKGEYDTAELLYRTAIDGAQRVLGVNHPTTVIFRNNLDDCLGD
jgi:tetratricopeptide (TPR) repeat protein